MIPPNARPRIEEILIEDYLSNGHCVRAQDSLSHFYQGYGAAGEIAALARAIECYIERLLERCIDLARTSSPRTRIFSFIKDQVAVNDMLACRILATALHRLGSDANNEGGGL